MIFLQPRCHLVQGDQAGCGQNTCLAHPATQRLTKITRPLDVFPAAYQYRSDRRAQALGEAEHHRAKSAGQPVYWDIQCGRSIENTRAVQMDG